VTPTVPPCSSTTWRTIASETEAHVRPRRAAVALAKRSKMNGSTAGSTPSPCLALRFRRWRPSGGGDGHVAGARGELDRVRQHVPDCLLQPPLVADDDVGIGIGLDLNRDAFRRRRGCTGFDRRVDRGGQIDDADVQPELAGDDA